MSKVAMILHGHLPYVRHPEYDRFLEEDWFFDSMYECYIPLVYRLNELSSEDIAINLTFCLSPTLITMMQDSLLRERFINYLDIKIELGKKEIEHFRDCPEKKALAEFYCSKAQKIRDFYVNDLNQDIVSAFRKLMHEDKIEIITTAATHAFFPLYEEYPVAVRAQVEIGIQTFVSAFGQMPAGFWLPDCGYYPGVEDILKEKGISWFPTSSTSMLFSQQHVKYGVYRPTRCPNGLMTFARDYNLASRITSESSGYVTDPEYRDFYRDAGFEREIGYLGRAVHEPEVRVFTGYKYFAITSSDNEVEKKVYDPYAAYEKTNIHAENFLYNIQRKTEMLSHDMDREPIYNVCFDVDLLGHWWYEGISWLCNVLRKREEYGVEFVLPKNLCSQDNMYQIVRPARSSWSNNGFSAIFLDSSNRYLIRHIHKVVERMIELADRFPEQTSLKQRFLNQAARETLLAMASDWPYIVYAKTSAEFAKKQLHTHLENVNVVYNNMCKNAVNTEWLVQAEKQNEVFPDIDYNIFNDGRMTE